MSARTRTASRASRASFRTPRTRLLAAATIAVAAFALTACEDGTGTQTSSAGSTSSGTSSNTSAGSSALQDTSSGTDGSGTDSGSSASKGTSGANAENGSANGSGTRASGSGGSGKGSSASGQSAGKQDSGKPAKCSSSTVRFTASKVNRPLNHLLLTATNHGSKPCVLPAYPMARFGDAQSVPPVIKASQPQSTVVLAPGGSGYAAVALASADGSGSNGHTVKTLSIPFDDGTMGTATLPSGGVFVDDSLKVTYWQSEMSNALEH
ncbi:hypothetical protein QFZ63_003655 [Streptomyces sp. B3I7]|uniref:DUF4232 domain-containing protein n=1 Tax=Streptomyces sp. B3I7 TaxID=3042269 RepID=UPI002788ED9F|nr:DUF4232 domain-containing protein [Streptomyces sp. B3I7]MDQ0811941.1 hypothetical protein [Streptomyces sp. B3I7]